MTNYAVGARLERLIKAQLERQGYTVMRSAGSKGKFDLCAWSGLEMRLIQAKARKITRAEREAMRLIMVPPCASVEIWERDDFGGWNVEVVKERVMG